jgi:hypothetical protein
MIMPLMKFTTPYITVSENGEVYILGEPEGLKALGELLITKAKLGSALSTTFSDGINPLIKIESSDDLNLNG